MGSASEVGSERVSIARVDGNAARVAGASRGRASDQGKPDGKRRASRERVSFNLKLDIKHRRNDSRSTNYDSTTASLTTFTSCSKTRTTSSEPAQRTGGRVTGTHSSS